MLLKRFLLLSKLSNAWSLKRATKSRRNGRIVNALRQSQRCRCAAEALEDRLLLSAAPVATPTFIIEGRASAPGTAQPAVTKALQPSFVAPIDPAQMQAAYGVNLISFNGIKGTGQGQTIAIVDAYNDPDIKTDANSFSSTFGLQQFNVAGGPTLQVLNETGGSSLANVPNSTPGGWDVEESLDVEWAHSIAPMANIILFEANSNSFSDLLTAEQTAADTAGVSTVSNSWASGEFSGESSYDSYFVTPNGHQGVTFLASTGDDGAPAGYPAYSPNVVAVGGTSLDINTSGTYQAESAWSGSGGGISDFESQPAYQSGKVNGLSSTQRTAPDISIDADPNTGVYVLDSYYTAGYLQVGGTSLACPMTAALISIADQGRILNGLTTLNGSTQTLPALYDLSSANLHDITTGNNGYPAGAGYDLATGLGSPIANNLVIALAGYQVDQPATVTAPLSASLNENSSYTFSGSSITATDSTASGTSDSLSLSVIDGTLKLGSTTGLTFGSGANNSSSMTVTGTLVNLDAALSGLVYTPTSGYSGSDFLQVSVFDANDNQTGWASVNVTVNAVTTPAVTAPSTASVTENQSFDFASTISVADTSASGTSDSVSISVANGILTLGSTTGLSFTQGLNASSSMTFSGTLANLNAALSGLSYTPNAGYFGSDSLPILVKDSGNGLSGSATVSITVNALLPTVTAPPTASLNENGSVNFLDAISVADPNASGSSDSVTLSVTHGNLTLGSTSGLAFSSGSNDSSSMTFSGTLSNLNAALSDLAYAPNAGYSGSDSLQISLKDSGNGLSGSATVSITVFAPPSVGAPANASLLENSSYTFSSTISVTDAAASGSSDSISLAVTEGTLTLGSTTGLSFTTGSNGASSMTFSGTLANLNAALSSVVYAPNNGYNGPDTLQISVTDSGDSLSGSASVPISVVDNWTSMSQLTPNNDGVGETMLLPNGDLLTHGGGGGVSSTWYEITPDSTGSYVNGTWTQVASMNVGRLYFGTDVLPNGEVFVVGGEYATDGTYDGQQLLSNSAEIYNPALNTWTMVASDPQPYVGDEPTEVLPGGNILVGNIFNNGTEIYDPTTNTWSTGGSKVHTSDRSDEESWVKLGNGDILAYDIFSSINDNKGEAELYNPTTNTWSDASNGNLPILSTPGEGYELGPALLLPNGNALFTGANGLTAYFNPTTNLWTQGPTMPVVNIDGVPTQLTTGDAPGAVLPNGDVMLALSPAVDGEDYPPPTYIYEFNPITGVYKNETPSPSQFYINYNSFIDDMLILPTGQLFLTDFSGDPVIYTPSGSPNSAWKPTISSVTENQNGSLTLTGTQLNGLDEGAAYGDDNQMAENYPIVRVTDNTTGAVYYATTSNWSSVGVATGSTPETVNVVLPAALGSDPFTLVVIADGIASSSFNSTSIAPVVTAPSAVVLNENTSYTFSGGSISAVDIDATATSDALSLSVSDGKLTLGSTSGLTFTSGSNGASSITVTGTLANLNAALNGLIYTPNSGYGGFDSLQISLKDAGDSLTGSAAVSITVNAPPKVSAPSAVSLSENGSYTFSGTISVTDAAASGTSDSLTLTVADGKLTLGSIVGLTFSSGSNDSSSMTVTGTLANLNAALNGLVYAPNSGYLGSDSLQISVNDSGDNLTGSATVAITVSNFPPPTITAPAAAGVNENSSLTFSGTISVTDAAASGTSESLTLSVTNGKLTLGSTTGLTFTSGSNGTSSLTVTGTLANLNAALNGLIYTPTANFSGHDTLRLSVTDSNDNLTSSAAVALSVNPYVTAPATANVVENSTYTFSSSASDPISLTDGAAAGTSDSLTLTVLHGKLTLATLTGLTFTSGSNGSSSLTVTGTLANLNAALNGLVYTPVSGYTGSDTLTIKVADAGDGLSGSANVAITIAPRRIVIGVALSGVTETTPDDQTTQWDGMLAAMDVLSG